MTRARIVWFAMSITAEVFSVQRIVPYLAASVAVLFARAGAADSPHASGWANVLYPSRARPRPTGR